MKQGRSEVNHTGARLIELMAIAISAGALLASCIGGQQQNPTPATFDVLQFDEINHSCREKGRFQDKEYCASMMEDRILAMGKDAVPILIAQLTDTRRTKEPLEDFWTHTTAGDAAYFILSDLFTDADWTTSTMPGLEFPRTDCATGAETCWREFVRKRGREHIQRQWRAAWNKYKDRMFWDEKTRCFRLSPDSSRESRP